MAREKGLASFSAAFEPQAALPLDARMVVPTRNDLFLTATWTANDGGVYAYKGMPVVVHSDPTPENNGLYILKDFPLTSVENWQKGSGEDLSALDIKTLYESNIDTNAYTDVEKDKLAALESSKFKGQFLTLQDLTDANVGDVGGYAYVDSGQVGETTQKYIWDDGDQLWILTVGEIAEETPATIKEKYEENLNTNAFTDAEKAKLSGIESEATKNQTDDYLLARENHTGTQAITTIEGLQTILNGLAVNDHNHTNKAVIDLFTEIEGVLYWNGEVYESGTDGDNGREVELRVSGTLLEWRYVNEGAWVSLIDFTNLDYITEAPDNDTPYARQNLQWLAIDDLERGEISLVGDGTETVFNLGSVIGKEFISVVVGGSTQSSNAYEILGSALTFTEPVPNGVKILVTYLSGTVVS